MHPGARFTLRFTALSLLLLSAAACSQGSASPATQVSRAPLDGTGGGGAGAQTCGEQASWGASPPCGGGAGTSVGGAGGDAQALAAANGLGALGGAGGVSAPASAVGGAGGGTIDAAEAASGAFTDLSLSLDGGP
jgi:hypothetical protein